MCGGSELILKPRQLSDIELLLNGALSPLEGFMNKADYEASMPCYTLSSLTTEDNPDARGALPRRPVWSGRS